MMKLLKKKCGKIFQTAFAKWRNRFHIKLYKREALRQFLEFKQNRLKTQVFQVLTAFYEQNNRMRDAARGALTYFNQKRRFKLLYLGLKGLRKEADRGKYHK
jgi:hypothetical protein